MTVALSPYPDPALYDVIYSQVLEDIPFYVALAQAAGGPVLEVGCGTGRVMIPTLEAGVEIHGLDLDLGMLERLRSKARARGLDAKAHPGDMRDFTMPGRYALVTIPFRAFQHLLTIDDQIRALRCMREHLDPGGQLAFNCFYPRSDAMREKDGVRTLSIETTHPETGRRVGVWDVSRYDRVAQRVEVEREIREDGEAGGGDARVTRAGFTLRWIYRFEMELLLRAAGFAAAEFFGGYDRRPLERDTDEMVVLARRD